MSAMSFWIWPSLNGETSSAGASTREICVGRWSRQRTRGTISICVQRLARHLAGTNGAVAQRSPACTSPGRFSAHRGASWDQARDPYQHPPSRPPRPPWPFSPPAHHAARHWGGVRPGTSGRRFARTGPPNTQNAHAGARPARPTRPLWACP
jgi:hypothetical protein